MVERENDLAQEIIAEMMAEDWEERPRGLLSDVDRQFLWGMKEYSHSSTASERRGDIRTRIEHGLYDLALLPLLDETQRKKVFDSIEENATPGELRDGIAALIRFLYLGLDGDQEWFEETIAHGISNAETDLQDDDRTFYSGRSVDAGVEVDIEVSRGYDVDELEEQLDSGYGRSLTPTEIGVLVREGRIDEEDIFELSSGKGGIPDFDDSEETLVIPDKKWFVEDTG